MGKSPDAFRTISEVADVLEVPQHVLRFWESKFNQIRPMKRGGGRRYYRPEDVDLLRGIRTLLYTEGYTIRGVQKVLKDQGVKYVSESGKDGALIAANDTSDVVEVIAHTEDGSVTLTSAEIVRIDTKALLSNGQNAKLRIVLAELKALRELLVSAEA